jgi:hypothetical protein
MSRKFKELRLSLAQIFAKANLNWRCVQVGRRTRERVKLAYRGTVARKIPDSGEKIGAIVFS